MIKSRKCQKTASDLLGVCNKSLTTSPNLPDELGLAEDRDVGGREKPRPAMATISMSDINDELSHVDGLLDGVAQVLGNAGHRVALSVQSAWIQARL